MHAKPMGIEFDTKKDAANLRKHGVPLSLGLLIIEDAIGSDVDERRDYGEMRANSYALLEERLYVCTYTIRGSNYRLISVRKASRQEQRLWQS
jgi:uncharacterized DUF497 family protein